MNTSNKGKSGAFGRDEMTALLGDGLSEALLRPTKATGGAGPGSMKKPPSQGGIIGGSGNVGSNNKHVSEMTVQETAAWLLEQQKAKAALAASGRIGKKAVLQQRRHRAATGRVLQHHQLLSEQKEEILVEEDKFQEASSKKGAGGEEKRPVDGSRDDGESEQEPSKQKTARSKATPVVLGKRRRRHDSSDESTSGSSESSSESDRGGRRNRAARRREDQMDSSSSGSSSSSESDSDSDDSEADHRRQRFLQKRRLQREKGRKQEVDKDSKIIGNIDVPKKGVEEFIGQGATNRLVAESNDKPSSTMKPLRGEANGRKSPPLKKNPDTSSSGSDDSSDDTDDDSSTDDESSSSEEEVALPRPMFVPKNRRGTIKAAEELEAEESERDRKRKEIEERRKRESRAMVQKVVAEASQAVEDPESALDGITGAQNAMPDDDDDAEDPSAARDAWEVRELARLIEHIDLEEERIREERELERRRKMTDEERLQEDIAEGRYQRPGQQKEAKDGEKFMQRYFHRGAYYMDQSEWDQSDVRHKAADYARAATGEDKVNKAALPSVMQVKRFGFANQNTRYKGLAAEDTTDRTTKMLPLHFKKSSRDKR